MEMSKAPEPLQTAVLFLVFNRPDTTSKVFEAIRKAKPAKLYVAADGARPDRTGEAEKVKAVREVATAVDWPCEVKTLFRNENLGCKHAVSGAISWFLDQEEQGIILEDDCLPHADFFTFCQSLLIHYKDDERVSLITGNNFQAGNIRGDASYYFSKYNHCWGWATWRRAWRYYQVNLPFWTAWSQTQDWLLKNPDRVERRYWSKIFSIVYENRIDSWAYPWTACVWYRGGLTVTPNVNLVSNIGFGPDSTHTKSANNPLAGMATHAIGILKHPVSVKQDTEADTHVFDHVFGGKHQRFPRSLLWISRRVGGMAFRAIKRISGL